MRVLLADNRQEVRSALRLRLEEEPDFIIVGEVTKAGEILEQARSTCADVILIDCELIGPKASEVVPALHALCPQILIITLCSHPEMKQAALAAGADAFISKWDSPESLLTTIKDCYSQQKTYLEQISS
jgi:DNA-binding NarL/FixJ family response regulator